MAHPINLQRFDLTTLRLFVRVVDAGSLTAGAQAFGISLAAASKRIAELENHMGLTLLMRSQRGVTPTPAGQTLQRHAVALVAGLEQLAMAMGDFHQGVGGHLRLWANPSAFNGFLPPLLGAYAEAYPGVKIDLEDALSEDAVRALQSGAAELAVIGEGIATGTLETFVCHIDELVLLCPSGHVLAARPTVAFEQALLHDFVTLPRATSLTRQISAAAEALGHSVKVRTQTRSFDAMCRMVAAGMGVCILPRTAAEPLASSLGLALTQLSGVRTERRLLMAMRQRNALSPAARALVDMVVPQ